ncbi:hypothetical protein J2S48_001946 [Promicromonospora iranensis]|uniref:Uncharacterized protein n=1 Tax=Promicromonospora iranensis TaxID=1105144 RepID=A0ABU2CM55_9MICO|nr:hypothetical protein [Promicromonospora iranensis]
MARDRMAGALVCVLSALYFVRPLMRIGKHDI